MKVTKPSSGWLNDWPHWLIIGGMFAASAIAWDRVTPPIPIHWGIRGQPDGFGGRFEGLLLIPLIAIGLYVLLLALPRFDPARANYASFSGPYRLMRLVLTALLGIVHALMVASALGASVDVGRWAPFTVGVTFAILGNVLGKVRPNYFVGIRTPWTLASARSWERTHRVGGRVFVAAGIAMAVAGLAAIPPLTVAVFIADGIAILGLVVYSYLAWRADPERVPVTGTTPAP